MTGNRANSFSPTELHAYLNTPVPVKRLFTTGVIDTGETGSLYQQVHFACIDLARLMVMHDFNEKYGSFWPLTEGLSVNLQETIARRFTSVAGNLEENARNGIQPSYNKEEISEAFGALYNALDPSAPQNQHRRFLIEKAFEVLGLGEIPKMQHVGQLQQAANQPKARTL